MSNLFGQSNPEKTLKMEASRTKALQKQFYTIRLTWGMVSNGCSQYLSSFLPRKC